MHTGKLVHLGHFGFSYFPSVDAANAFAAGMDVKHDLGRLFAVQGEKNLEHFHHEIHGREIIVKQHDLVQRRPDHLGFRGLHHRAMFVLVFAVGFLGHGASINRLGRHRMRECPVPRWTKAGFHTKMIARGRAGATTHKDGSRLNYRRGQFWQPDVTVATIVARDGKLLMVEEAVQGRQVLNQPAGHLEPDESLHAAALRETLEETGWRVQLTAFVGAYQWKAPVESDGTGGRHYLRIAFAAEPLSHDAARPLDEGIIRALWMTPRELEADARRHRSPLVWRVVEDYLAGRRFPLDALAHLP